MNARDGKALKTGEIAFQLSRKIAGGDPAMQTSIQKALQQWIRAGIKAGRIKAEPPPPDGRSHHYYRVSISEFEKLVKETPTKVWTDLYVRCLAKIRGTSSSWIKKRYLQKIRK